MHSNIKMSPGDNPDLIRLTAVRRLRVTDDGTPVLQVHAQGPGYESGAFLETPTDDEEDVASWFDRFGVRYARGISTIDRDGVQVLTDGRFISSVRNATQADMAAIHAHL